MADQQQQQQQHEADDNQEELKPTANVTDVKTLTNIYHDCLERIFDHLELADLLNLAQTCKRLKIAAAAKFSDDFGRKKVNLLVNGFGFPMSLVVSERRNNVDDSNIILPFLRCFGAKISSLAVTQWRVSDDAEIFESGTLFPFRKANKAQIAFLDKYINQFCAKKR